MHDEGPVEAPGQDRLVAAAEVAAPFEATRRGCPLRDVAQGLFDLFEALVDLDLTGVDLAFLPLFSLSVDLLVLLALGGELLLLFVEGSQTRVEHRGRLVAPQQVDGLGVAHTREGLLHTLEGRPSTSNSVAQSRRASPMRRTMNASARSMFMSRS